MTENLAVCGSCSGPARSYGSAWKNERGQYLVKIKPHMTGTGKACYARIGVVTGK